jgi:hypothetical protein
MRKDSRDDDSTKLVQPYHTDIIAHLQTHILNITSQHARHPDSACDNVPHGPRPLRLTIDAMYSLALTPRHHCHQALLLQQILRLHQLPRRM